MALRIRRNKSISGPAGTIRCAAESMPLPEDVYIPDWLHELWSGALNADAVIESHEENGIEYWRFIS